MLRAAKSRILVADDDLGVIAAYRYVLEGDEQSRISKIARISTRLEKELFGESGDADANALNWLVHFVDQGVDAVEAVRAAVADFDPFSVVFLDIRMPPGIDGYETAAKIRQIDADVHIVFVSGYSDYTVEELFEVCGPEHKVSFVPKPVWPHQLKTIARTKCEETHRRRA